MSRIRWNEKKVLDAYYKKCKGDCSDYDEAPEYVKDYIIQLDSIFNSDEYDNVPYITEFIRDAYIGEVVNLFGVRYIAADRGKPVGKFVAVKADGKIGFGYSKLDVYEEIPINLIGNHIGFMMAKKNALENVSFENILKTSKLNSSQKKQFKNFFLRAYKYFHLQDNDYYNKLYEQYLSEKKIVPEDLKEKIENYVR